MKLYVLIKLEEKNEEVYTKDFVNDDAALAWMRQTLDEYDGCLYRKDSSDFMPLTFVGEISDDS